MKLTARLDFIIEYGVDHLSTWEEEFIDSIQIAVSQGKDLSWKQQKCLLRIYKKVENKIG